MKANGFVRARVQADLAYDTDATAIPNLRAIVAAAKANGIQLECVLQTPFAWGDRFDHGQYPKGDAAALYSQGYNRVYNFVSQFSNEKIDWELSNEVNLLAADAKGNRLYGKGMTPAEFDQPIMNDWANVLKGMSDAIEAINVAKGLHIRRILGTTSTMFGFIDFMISKGVRVDVVGYHYYEGIGVDPYKYWLPGTSGFDLFAKFASYKRPVHVNEMNCAEIYSPTFVNDSNSSIMQTCNTNLSTMLKTFTSQTEANIEAIFLYELLDEPAKAAPENHFGLLYNIQSPKPTFATAASFAKAALGPPSVTYPSSVIPLKINVPARILPTVVNVSGNLNCVGILLPQGLNIDSYSCVISGTPIVLSQSGAYNVATIIVSTTGNVDIVGIQVIP